MNRDDRPPGHTADELRAEVELLRARLREAEDTLGAIRRGEVDALVVDGPGGGRPRVYTLTTADETYRLLVEQMREGAVTVSASDGGLILYCNRCFAETLKLPPERLVGSPIGAYGATAADRDALAAVVAAGSEGHDRELDLRAGDGTTVSVHVSAGALTVAGTEVRGLVVTDLTRQATRARLASIVESSDDAILAETPDRVVTSWNAGAEKLLGFTAAEMVGRSAAALEAPERIGETDAVLRRLRETGVAQRFETVRLRKDGGRVDVSLTVSPIRDAGGGIAALSVIGRDITERRRAEAALRAAHARTVEILESISDGFISLDRAWRFTYVNPAAARLLGRAAADLLGKGLWDAFPAAKGTAIDDGLSRAMSRRTPVRFEGRQPAGSDAWFEVRAYPSPEGLSVFFADVTERRRADERLRLLAAELDHRVKNTLASVLSLVARSHHPGDTAERFAERLEGRLGAKARAHNLLTASRWEGAGLRDIVAQELEPYRGTGAGADNVVIDGPEVVLRPAAALSLSLVVHELAVNAAKYGALSRPAGRVEVRWAAAEGAGRPGGGRELVLRWVESGGPPVEAPSSRGFGSSVIERSVPYELDGEACLEFPPDGVRCTLRMPLAAIGREGGRREERPPAAAAPAPDDRQPAAGPAGKRILVVEDAALVALDIEAALGALGCEVVGPVGRLDRALALARAQARLDGAILDVNLDGEVVFPLADELIGRGVPVIFSTGYNGSSFLPERYRGRPRLEKPFGVEALQRLSAEVFS